MSTWTDAMDQPLWGYGPDGALMPPGDFLEAPERPEGTNAPVGAVVASETTGDPSALSLRARVAVAHLALFGFNPHQLRGPDGRWVKMPTHLRKERRRERDRERRAAKKAERDGGKPASPVAEPADDRAAERPGSSAQRKYREARDRFNREMVDHGQFQVNDNDFEGIDDPALALDLKSLKAALVRGDDLEADEAADRLRHGLAQRYPDVEAPAIPDEGDFDPEVKAQRALREALDRYNAEIHADALEWVAEANEPDVDWSLWGLSDAQGAVFADALFERTARLGAAIQDNVPAAADRAAAQLRRLFVDTGVRPDHDFNSLPTIEEFREQGRVMAPPPARKANPLLTGGSGHRERLAQLEQAVATGVWGEEELGQGAMGETKKQLLNDGTTVINKRAKGTWPYGGVDWTAIQQTDAEELSALVGSALGLRSPAVQRVDDTTINMEFVPDATPAFNRYWNKDGVDFLKVPGEILGSDDGLRMGLLDTLIGNPDRHGFNWMVDDDDRIYPIDNGLAFVNLKGTNESDAARSPFAREYFVHPTGRFKENILTRRDIQWVREQMEALAPEFQRVGQPGWYTQIQNRLRQMEIRARGGSQHQLPAPQGEVRSE